MADEGEKEPPGSRRAQELIVKAGLGFGAVAATAQVIGAAVLIVRRVKLEAQILLGHDVERPPPIERRLYEAARKRWRPTRRERLQRRLGR